MTCTFFGNRDAPNEIYPTLYKTIRDLVETDHVTLFYVGNHGKFDGMVRHILHELRLTHPITYHVVLAYLPTKPDKQQEDTLFPEGIEKTPKRFSILWRNRWMLEQADVVVIYARNTMGGTGQMLELAQKKNKKIIRLELMA